MPVKCGKSASGLKGAVAATGNIDGATGNQASFYVKEILGKVVKPGGDIDITKGASISKLVAELLLICVSAYSKTTLTVQIGKGVAGKFTPAKNVGDGAITKTHIDI